jgi:hypothetical protein
MPASGRENLVPAAYRSKPRCAPFLSAAGGPISDSFASTSGKIMGLDFHRKASELREA